MFHYSQIVFITKRYCETIFRRRVQWKKFAFHFAVAVFYHYRCRFANFYNFPEKSVTEIIFQFETPIEQFVKKKKKPRGLLDYLVRATLSAVILESNVDHYV